MSQLAASSLTGSAYRVAAELSYNTFGWRFDARALTGNSAAYVDVVGGYNTVTAFQIVIDTLSNEIYGRYDHGGGFVDTAHFAISSAQRQSLDGVIGFGDYRGANGGATTSWGKAFSNAELDNLSFSQTDADPVSAPTAVALLLAALPGLRRQRQ